MVRIVTAFTLAHSVTLSLGALGIVTMPDRIIEPLIAATIVWVALENLFAAEPDRRRWIWSFGFGLVHGFGFASALGELGLKGAALVRGLVGFNLGCRDRAAAFRRRLPAGADVAVTRPRRAADPAHRLADGGRDRHLLAGRTHLCWLNDRIWSKVTCRFTAGTAIVGYPPCSRNVLDLPRLPLPLIAERERHGPAGFHGSL